MVKFLASWVLESSWEKSECDAGSPVRWQALRGAPELGAGGGFSARVPHRDGCCGGAGTPCGGLHRLVGTQAAVGEARVREHSGGTKCTGGGQTGGDRGSGGHTQVLVQEGAWASHIGRAVTPHRALRSDSGRGVTCGGGPDAPRCLWLTENASRVAGVWGRGEGRGSGQWPWCEEGAPRAEAVHHGSVRKGRAHRWSEIVPVGRMSLGLDYSLLSA